MKNHTVPNELHIVSSGEEALDFLYCRGKYSGGTCRPDLILLDLNMPRMGGKEFLTRIKKAERLRKIPVIVLTTSDLEEDIIDSYNLYANAYVKKSMDPVQFKEVVKKIGEYWFVTCKLPPRKE